MEYFLECWGNMKRVVGIVRITAFGVHRFQSSAIFSTISKLSIAIIIWRCWNMKLNHIAGASAAKSRWKRVNSQHENSLSHTQLTTRSYLNQSTVQPWWVWLLLFESPKNALHEKNLVTMRKSRKLCKSGLGTNWKNCFSTKLGSYKKDGTSA